MRYLLVPMLLLAACSAAPVGEVGRAACSNREDDDHDGVTDCEDADCQNLDLCRGQVLPVDPGIDAGGGSGGSTTLPPIPDAGRQTDEDAGTDEEDGGMVPPPLLDAGPINCSPACAATEECIDGTCTPVAAEPIRLLLTIRSAAVANMGPLIGECFDEGVLCTPYNCNGPCVVDPYVSVVHIAVDGAAVELFRTAAVSNTTTPEFDGPQMEVELLKGDTLRFDVLDDNRGTADSLLFSCEPDLSVPKPGRFTCVARQSSVLRRLEINAEFAAE